MLAKVAGSAEFKVGQGDKTWSELPNLEGVLGSNLLYNSEEWITESGTWTAPVTGWYDVLLIGGGHGGIVNHENGKTYVYGGHSGDYQQHLMLFQAGHKVSVTIGSGGLGITQSSSSPTTQGQVTSFGNKTTKKVTEDGWRGFTGSPTHQSTASLVGAPGRGFGGGLAGGSISYANAKFYGAGGGSGASLFTTPVSTVAGNGKQGAVRVRYYDPAKT